MCVTNRKIPVLGVTIFSAITLILSLVMVGFAVRFNNSGFSKDLGEFDDYTNEAFVILFAASLIAFVASVCGLTSKLFEFRNLVYSYIKLPARDVAVFGGRVQIDLAVSDFFENHIVYDVLVESQIYELLEGLQRD